MQVGATMTATARLINSTGDSVPSKTPKWSTSNASVATVDQNGVITGVAAGSATITASADNAKGTLPLIVDVDRCVNPLSMDVGQVSIQSGPERRLVHNDCGGDGRESAAVHHRERDAGVR